jgi:hypothetical protein
MTLRSTGYNSRFAKAGVSCFYDSEVLNSSFLHLMKFSAEKTRLRKAAKRYSQCRKSQEHPENPAKINLELVV